MKQSQTHTQKKPLPDFHVLIASAGSGLRMGIEIPKQYMYICGKPVLRHSIDVFLDIPECQSIRVVIGAGDADLYQNAVKGLNLPASTLGGKERNLSIHNGLKSLSNLKNDDIILIHDAARPCVEKADIEKLLQTMNIETAASLATPITSTLRRTDVEGAATQNIARDGVWALQTPQAFRYGDILKAHENVDKNQNYTDDTTLASENGINVKLVEGSATNIKITTAKDLKMATQFLEPPALTLSGLGFDVHSFDKASPGPVRLCGINVDHSYALKGHSDADVALHALTDAILGAIGAGDIGQHFPPSNQDFKDMDSAVFLEKALQLTDEKHGQLLNIDLTIICEEPKIGPHVQDMRKRLAELTKLPTSRINIKATTTEGLGFTGRKEGIAAQALATVSLPDKADAE